MKRTILISSILVIILAGLSCKEYRFENPVEPGQTIVAPSNLQVPTFTETLLVLQWEIKNLPTNYPNARITMMIESSTDGVAFETVDTTGAESTTESIPGIFAAGIIHSFRVRAKSADNYSSYSNVAQATWTLKAPSNLVVTSITPTSANLVWTDNSTFETGFVIERSTDGTDFALVDSAGADVTTKSVAGMYLTTTTYSFRVRARTTHNYSGYSNVVTVTPTFPALLLSATQLAFGSNLTNMTFVISNKGTGTLTWSIGRKQSWLAASPTNGTNQSIINVYVNRLGLNPGSYVEMLSITSNGGSDSVNVSMIVPAPSNPTAVTLNAPTNITASSIELNWTQNNDADFKQYEVHRSTGAGFTPGLSTLAQTIVDRSTNSATLSGLAQSTTYCFKIRVINTSDLFSDSNERTGTPLAGATGPYTPDVNTIALYHFDEASGNSVADASGKGNNGTAYGTSIVNGKFGKARSMNGTSDWMQVPSSSSLQVTNAITVEAWIYLTVQDLDWNSFVSKMAEGYGIVHGYDLRMVAGHPIFTLVAPAGTFNNHEAGGYPIPINQWTHLAATYDGAKVRIYMNGTQIYEAPQTGSIAVGSEDLFIGKQNVTSNNRFTSAIIDEVRISNIARNPSEFHLGKR